MTFRVLTAEFVHETNTFSVRKTDYDAFAVEGIRFGEDAVRVRGEANTEIAGFLDIGRKYHWTIQHVVSAGAEPAGPVTRDAFDRIGGAIVQAAKDRKGDLDGIMLGLHGAMVTDFSPDGEGELLERLRAVVGPDLPIAVTLDPHANVTAKMCQHADILISFKTYPHIDMRDTARHAGELLQRTMAGEIDPKTFLVRRPMLEEANAGRTDIGPMVGWIAEARAYETMPGALAVSINGAFPYADISEVGATVLVTYDGDCASHQAFAESIATKIWDDRFNVLNTFHTVEAAAEIARAYNDDRPLIIADYADNPGAGAYGDATNLLEALLDAGVHDACFGPIVDPETALQLHRSAVGETVQLALGGKTDARFGGGPLKVAAKLVHISDGKLIGDGPMMGGLELNFGPTAVIQIEGIAILVVTEPSQMYDLQQFRAFGIDPASHRVVGLKSMQHFRAAFEPIAGKVIVCDSGALCTMDYARMPYGNVPRPIFPLDRDMII
ncbi:M81 family metallopeptidase [Mesorhizobium sp. M6A.T.Cr.TU.016.01.1.1]|uniref:M81 family metallopeptidase n=1 Tax=Mesorhizobium sp. M6A.T.Cr.TU.016.01.1.1 TaxID=2493677 RepID=UPI000F74F0D3|nr:M81 family metallopeptidase [Mesorhizobium sp. M6A.T.Cr.TU.016.01.1.1]AZO68056.1 M81 family peptidase [Mesorhizobium sp. M6A.T.Cr.TU.016.01.1.1]